jgi:ComF family protein
VFSRAMQSLRDGLLSLSYPQPCRVCAEFVESWNDGVICAVCWQDPSVTSLFIHKEICWKCGVPLPAVQKFAQSLNPESPLPTKTAPQSKSQVVPEMRQCGRCRELPFAVARACGVYAGSLEANVRFLKSHPHLCRRLRDLIRQAVSANSDVLISDVVMPVPLHPRRKAERGFNQAELIASWIAAEFDLALDTDVLGRSKNTERHRAGLDAIDRARSVERAFAIKDDRQIRNHTVLLVDDVFTTGSTVSAAADCLRQAGASRIAVFTIARVPSAS